MWRRAAVGDSDSDVVVVGSSPRRRGVKAEVKAEPAAAAERRRPTKARAADDISIWCQGAIRSPPPEPLVAALVTIMPGS